MVKSIVIVTILGVMVGVGLVLDMVEAMNLPNQQYDYDNFKELYDLMLRNEPSMFRSLTHQMERKGGRQPSLRLRFGKRSDPFGREVDGVLSRLAQTDSDKM